MMEKIFRDTMGRAEFAEPNQIKYYGAMKHNMAYINSFNNSSFNKFFFTRAANTLGSITAREIKGNDEYVLS